MISGACQPFYLSQSIESMWSVNILPNWNSPGRAGLIFLMSTLCVYKSVALKVAAGWTAWVQNKRRED